MPRSKLINVTNGLSCQNTSNSNNKNSNIARMMCILPQHCTARVNLWIILMKIPTTVGTKASNSKRRHCVLKSTADIIVLKWVIRNLSSWWIVFYDTQTSYSRTANKMMPTERYHNKFDTNIYENKQVYHAFIVKAKTAKLKKMFDKVIAMISPWWFHCVIKTRHFHFSIVIEPIPCDSLWHARYDVATSSMIFLLLS